MKRKNKKLKDIKIIFNVNKILKNKKNKKNNIKNIIKFTNLNDMLNFIKLVNNKTYFLKKDKIVFIDKIKLNKFLDFKKLDFLFIKYDNLLLQNFKDISYFLNFNIKNYYKFIYLFFFIFKFYLMKITKK